MKTYQKTNKKKVQQGLMTANLRNIFANSVIVLYKSHKRVINKTKHCITVTEWKNDKNKYNVD